MDHQPASSAMQAHLAALREAIARDGWSVQGNDGVYYTAGCSVRDFPELVIRGVCPDDGACVLNELAGRMDRSNAPFEDEQITQFHTVITLRFRQLEDTSELAVVRELFPAHSALEVELV